MIKYIIIVLICIFIIFCLYRSYKYENNSKMFGYNFFKYVLKLVFKFYYPYKVLNKSTIPESGPVVLCGNHINVMDQCLALLLTKRPVHYMAKIEYFQSIKTKWFFSAVGCIPVDRSIHDDSAKSAAIEVLKNKNILGIFPEGTRNKTREILLPFKFGAVSMANKTNATIVPYAITGHYKFRTKDLRIKFGKPFKVGDMTLEEANNKLREEILMLITNK